MSRVFIFESTHLDISGMSKYGEVVTLFEEGASRRPLRDQKLESQILGKLITLGFNVEKDYVGIVGSHLGVCIFISAIVSTYGAFRCVVFDAVRQDYFERNLGHMIDQDIFEVSRG